MLDPRWTSENGVWEIGVHPVMFGKRIRAGRVDRPFCAIDLCAGGDEDVLKQLAVLVMYVLESFPEDVLEREVEDLMPWCRTKPINNDPCWDELRKLAVGRRLLNSANAQTT